MHHLQRVEIQQIQSSSETEEREIILKGEEKESEDRNMEAL